MSDETPVVQVPDAPAAPEAPQAAPGAPVGTFPRKLTITWIGPGQYSVADEGFARGDVPGLLGLLEVGRFMILDQVGPKRPQPKIELPPAAMPRVPFMKQLPPGRYGGRP